MRTFKFNNVIQFQNSCSFKDGQTEIQIQQFIFQSYNLKIQCQVYQNIPLLATNVY